MSNLKLGVEVVAAHDLMLKDGTASTFVELHFDHQRFRTTVKERDLNPVWNESFYFNVTDPNDLSNMNLEAYVYNHGKANTKSCLGKVCLTGTSFVPYSDACVLHYPLEKKGLFSRVKGELGLKVFVTDDPSIRSSNPLPAMDSSMDRGSRHTHSQPPLQQVPNIVPNPFSDDRADSRHTFRHLPNPTVAQQQNIPSAATQPLVNYGMQEMRSEPQGPQVVRMYSGSLDPYVEVKIGNYKGVTKHFEKQKNPEWNEVFAFAKDNQQAHTLEVVVKDKDLMKDDYVGFVRFDLHEVPHRVPPDSPLAPEWYRIENKKGEKRNGELMLAVWYGTQADEAFPDAWHSDAIGPDDTSSATYAHSRSKVYHSPRLWYVRVNVIEAQDLIISDRSRFPDAYAKVQIGNQVLKTKTVQTRVLNPMWNEDLMFVAAEPFDDHLIVSVEDRVGPNKDETLGRVAIPLNTVERRADDRNIRGRWYNLEKHMSDALELEGEQRKKDKEKDKFSSRIHLRVCLDGGYHVLDESTHYSSDLRPTAKPLWKSSIGVLELGILNADGLHPMKTRDGKGTADTYCVAKYGHKWVRTRTINNSLSPKYNEQYTWEVFDPATVLTVGVFDNTQIFSHSNGHRDVKIGKVRIRMSTLETGRVYTHSYPLLVLHPSGVKKMGELHLAIRFSCTSLANMMFKYSRPLLPKMHYVRPLTVVQQDMLRHQAVSIVAARLSRAEPPLRKEVVEYMSDADSHLWSMRRSKANFFRLMTVFAGLFAVGKWFGEVCMWKNPITTALVHVLFVMLVCFPELILPTVFLYMFLIGIWNFRYRPRYPPHMNTRISYADAVHPDELDEEFDTFPTSRGTDIVRMRYDRLRSVAGRIQTVVGDVATQGERIQSLLSWRDPRATMLFITFCLVAAIVLYVTPFQVLVLLGGVYFMRHPRFRHKMPSAPVNFFRRLPARTDSML
ncbi:hypothetical protein ACLB2K_076739 [Fragaria x ananassa]